MQFKTLSRQYPDPFSAALLLTRPTMIMLLFLSVMGATDTLAAFQPSPCLTGRPFGSLSCSLSPGFVPEFRRAGVAFSTVRNYLHLHQSNDNGSEVSKSEKAKENLQSAAAFVAMKLQMVLLTKAMEEDAKGGSENSAKIMASIEKMMQPKAPKKEVETKPADTTSPASEETKKPATKKKPDIGLKRTSSGTSSLPQESKKEELKVTAKPAQPKIDVPSTPKPKPAKATPAAPIKEKVATKAKKEESKPAAVSKADTTKGVGAQTSSSPRTELIPPCISTDFGQALPTIVEDLPALREPVAVAPKPTEESNAAVATTKKEATATKRTRTTTS